MKKIIRIILPLALLALPTAAMSQARQETSAADTVSGFYDKIMARFLDFYSRGIDEKLYIQTDKPYYSAGDSLWLKGYLSNAITHVPQSPSNYIYVELVGRGDSLVERMKVKRDSCGFDNVIRLPSDLPEGNYLLRGYTLWMTNQSPDYFFKRTIRIANPFDRMAEAADGEPKRAPRREPARQGERTDDFDMQFFPEGGALIASTMQRVAFKATGADGLSVEVSGGIYNSRDEQVSEVSSVHRGMGYFSLIAPVGEKYHARIVSSRGVEKRFELPEVVAEGYALHILTMRGRIICDIVATPGMPGDSLALLVHSRGRVLIAEDLVPSVPKAIPMDMLPVGIVQFTLVHKSDFEPLSRRLVFIPGDEPQVGITADSPDYGRREKVTLSMRLTGTDGAPVTGGQFAVSVTDRGSVHLDSLRGDIRSYMLLSSDLKGHIEDPGYYFPVNTGEKAATLDLLMMTQGWTRFDISDLLAGRLKSNSVAAEDSQRIKGSVHGFFGGAAKSPSLLLFSPQSGFMDTFTLDKSNIFTLSGLDFPDSTSFILQAISRGGSNRSLTLKIEPEPLPSVSGLMPASRTAGKIDPLPASFINRSRELHYNEQGMKVIDLESVVVTAERPEPKTLYNVTPSHSRSGKDLEAYQGSTIYAVLQTFPGVRMGTNDEGGTGISIRGSADPPLLYVDNMPMDVSELDFISVMDVAKIDLVTGPEAGIFGLGASGGVILVTLKSGADVTASRPPLPSLALIKPLGFKKPAAFYQPRYDVAAVRESAIPDVRTTLLWAPCVTPDQSGEATVWFYTSDDVSTYDVVLEGITDTGEVCRATATVERK